MTKWLHQQRFSYKQPKAVPAKADVEKQEAFIEKYLQLLDETPANEPIFLWIQPIRQWQQKFLVVG